VARLPTVKAVRARWLDCKSSGESLKTEIAKDK